MFIFKAIIASLCCSLSMMVPLKSSLAAPPELSLPINCTIGIDCWVVNFVDQDPGPNTRDFSCTTHTYDGHKGTDFVLPHLAAMKAGVDVYASASGIVRGIRDGVADSQITKDRTGKVSKTSTEATKGRECGNGLMLDHGDGWETQYCHMRKGSLLVKLGERVMRGDTLGMVGLSGLTEMPHLHLSVRHNGAVVDPFDYDGTDNGATVCDARRPRNTLWKTQQNLKNLIPESALYLAGFSDHKPDLEAIRKGGYALTHINPTAAALVLWVEIFWVHKGDEITASITAPNGEVFASRTLTQDKTQARRTMFIGKKYNGKPWPVGAYTGVIEIKRPLKDGTSQTLRTTRLLTVE